MSVHAYHPGTGADVVVDNAQLDHMRASGWMLLSEYEAQQAGQQPADSAVKPKTAKSASEEK